MMKNFFIVKNNQIINIIVADSVESAEALSDAEAIPVEDDRDPEMNIGSVFIDGRWVKNYQNSPE